MVPVQVVLKAKGSLMRLVCSIKRCIIVVMTSLFCVLQPGCGGGSSGNVSPGPLKDRDAIASALPQGVTLESPVVPDVFYGQSAKTVEDALASLQAYVRDQTIYDGGLGREIRFEHGGKKSTDGKSQKKQPKSNVPYTVIMLAD
jgi:hypothetical protein